MTVLSSCVLLKMYFKTGKEAPSPPIMGEPDEENSFLFPHYWGLGGVLKYILNHCLFSASLIFGVLREIFIQKGWQKCKKG